MTEARTPYPVRVDASMDAPLSRWLWLVKWLMLIPHYVLLAFLWIAFWVLTVVAFFAILITGRYPHALFDFNVGVLRWSWRVHYYGYAALGTDRYPPFTLADVPEYPAHLEVAYPERLSRGLVLIKSWLLALPHWLVLGVFLGGGIWLIGRDGPEDTGWAAGGLVGLLVLIAAITLLFTGRYPHPVYDFVLGMDRWVLRVAAYVALMTDRYPPFRLDMGGTDPGSRPVGPAAPPPTGGAAPPVAVGPVGSPPPAPQRHPADRWSPGRVVAVVLGAVLLFTSTGLLAGGGGLAWADLAQREDGYVWTSREDLTTDRYALATGDITLDTAGEEWVVDDVLGIARLEVTAADPSTEIFVGIAPRAEAAEYLRGVGHRQIDGFGPGGETRGAVSDGGAPATLPGNADIWVAQAEGAGTQSLDWRPAGGDWTAVVMRADGAAGLAVEARAGATAPGLPWLWGGLLAAGGLLLVVGAVLVALGVHRAQSRPPGAGPARPAHPLGPLPGRPDPGSGPPAPRNVPAVGSTVNSTPGSGR